MTSRSRGIAGLSAARRPRIVLEHCQQQLPAVAVKRPLAGEHFVEHDAQAVDVAAGIDLVRRAASLLGRHVGRRAEHAAVGGHRLLAGLLLGQAKVHQVRMLPRVEDDVRGLDVAMNDAVLVGVVECVGQLGGDVGRLRGRKRAALAAGLPASSPSMYSQTRKPTPSSVCPVS